MDNSQWNTSLEKLLWRIDLQSNTGSDRSPTSTKSKSNNSSNENSNTDQDNINTGIAEPTVIVQMNLRNKRSNGLDVVHFEMDSEQINRIVKEIEGIEGVVSRIV